MTVSFSPEEQVRELQKALAEERLAREQAEEGREQERVRAEQERVRAEQERIARVQSDARAEQAEEGREQERLGREKAEETLAAQNVPVRDCIRGATITSKPLRPAWGDELLPDEPVTSTVTSVRWHPMNGDDVERWPETEFVQYLRTADDVMVNHNGASVSLLELILNGKTDPTVANVLTGKTLGDILRIKDEIHLESILASTIWLALECIMGSRYMDVERCPASQYIETYIPPGKAAGQVAGSFTKLLKSDRTMWSRLLSPGEPLRNPGKTQDVFPDFMRQSNDADFERSRFFSRTILEMKPDWLCPKKMDEHTGAAAASNNVAYGGDLVDYMKSQEFDPKHNPVAQVVTYGIVTLTSRVAVCTGNHMTYGRINLDEEALAEKKPLATLTKTFDWSSSEPPLALEPTWSNWEVLIRWNLASFGEWYLNKIPDVFKQDFKRRVETGGDSDNQGPKKRQSTGNDGDKDSSSASSAFQGGGGKGGVQSTSYALSPLFWEDLWAPLRFAVPATHSVEMECTWAHLSGDAELLAEGRMGSVYRQPLQGYDVVIKTLPFSCKRDVDDMRDVYPFMLRDEMKHEVDVYNRLTKLQGCVVPRLLWYGEIIAGMADALATEYAGEALTAHNLSLGRAQGAAKALEAIHSNGVLHGDIALRNFCAKGDVVMIIDFGFAKFKEDFSDDDEWQVRVEKERHQLRKELEAGRELRKRVEKTVPSGMQPNAGQKRGFEEV